MQVQKNIVEWYWDSNRRIASAVTADGTTIGYWLEEHPGSPDGSEWDPDLWHPLDPNFSSLKRCREYWNLP